MNRSRAEMAPQRTHRSDLSPEPTRPTEEQIAIAAYYRAQARGFEPGHEIEDWLEAEGELTRGARPS